MRCKSSPTAPITSDMSCTVVHELSFSNESCFSQRSRMIKLSASETHVSQELFAHIMVYIYISYISKRDPSRTHISPSSAPLRPRASSFQHIPRTSTCIPLRTPRFLYVKFVSETLTIRSRRSLIGVRIYSEIAQFIPGDVLYYICEAMEDEDPDAVYRKHRKNLNILSMMDVCRSWNRQINQLSGSLLADIAFDTSDHATISTADKCLGIIEARSSNLRIYARCDVYDQTQTQFISRLRLHSWRFVRFEVEHTSAPFIASFDLPAPRLLSLVHYTPLLGELFALQFTNLRVLDASVEGSFPWTTATLSHLVVLRLMNPLHTLRFCAASLFDLIDRAPRLEELRLTNFLRFSGTPLKTPLAHADMKLVHLIQCNAGYILQHLRLTNIDCLHVESSHAIDLAGEPDPPPEAHPILEQHLFTKVTLHVRDLPANGIHFELWLLNGEQGVIGFTTTAQREGLWEDYLRWWINGIVQCIHLGPEVELSIFNRLPSPPVYLSLLGHRGGPSSPVYSPFLRLPQVTVLTTDNCLVCSVMAYLAGPGQMALPDLNRHLFDIGMLPPSVDQAVAETVTFINGSPFAMTYWQPNGKVQLRIVPYLSVDIIRSTGAITTASTEQFSPALTPTLRRVNDGSIGWGGYVVGVLYIENSVRVVTID